ncbi:Histone acetyltransferase HAC12 [Apostasia shenzhenica]|uniref:histone acetyltransferase n=1 Tax=Apostasia shenzhenica TaxID=1088818 RepID=A0A2I0A529_9ASPA|nr:Histone acetyltransferase HAC12 [Apostasia shenzhenica]
MNVPAHLSGLISGQGPNPAGMQVAGPSQPLVNSLSPRMQSFAAYAYGMDPELLASRQRTQDVIIQVLQRKNYHPNLDVMQRIPELARRLEERIYRDAIIQGEDYRNMPSIAIEQRLLEISKNFGNNQHSRHISSTSAASTMIPTPGMVHSGNKGPVVSANNSLISCSGGSMITEAATNMGNLSYAKGSFGVGKIASFNSSSGAIINSCQQSTANNVHTLGRSSILSSMGGMTQQSCQLIPTPGLNSQQFSVHSESGFSSMGSAIVSQQQQRNQYIESPNSRVMQSVGGHLRISMRSNLQHKAALRGFGSGVLNGCAGSLAGSSLQHVNGNVTSDVYMGAASYSSSPKPLQQHFDSQSHQSLVPPSVSHQMSPLIGDGYGMSTSSFSGSGNIHGSPADISSANSQKLNPGMNVKSNINHEMVIPHANISMMLDSPKPKLQLLHNSSNMDLQSTQSIHEQLLQSQHQMPNFQHQQFQQSNQPHRQLDQEHISKTDPLRMSSMTSSIGGLLIPEQELVSNNESLLEQVNDQFQLPQFQNQHHKDTISGNLSRSAQLLDEMHEPHEFQPSISQDSLKTLHGQLNAPESQNGLSCFTLPHGQWCSQPPQKSQMLEKESLEQHVLQEDFNLRMKGQGMQKPQISSNSTNSVAFNVHQSAKKMSHGPVNAGREQDYFNQRRWLLLLLHSRKCPSPKGQCKEANCIRVQQLWVHINSCNSTVCMFPRCSQSRKLFNHYKTCQAADCPVCIPVRDLVASIKERTLALSDADRMKDSWKNAKSLSMDNVITEAGSPPSHTSEGRKPSSKRIKVQHAFSLLPNKDACTASVPPMNQNHAPVPHVTQPHKGLQADGGFFSYSEEPEVNMDASSVYGLGSSSIFDSKDEDKSKSLVTMKHASELSLPNEFGGHAKKEIELCDEKLGQQNEIMHESIIAPTDATFISKSMKTKISGVSLTELFTPEEIRDHIINLRQWVGQSKAKAEKNQAMERTMNENSCQLCAVERLTFEPPPIYCTPCGARIKRNAMYYVMGIGDTRHYFCIPCYNEARGDTIDVEGSNFPKSKLQKKKNDEETEESWVQCDKCEAWQHQVCALFNGRRNDGDQAAYTCPNCCIEEIEKGERMPLPQTAVLGAKDLPRTILSDHIEQRLFRRLKQERQERARQLGKSVDEVPGVEALVVRVVSSVDKKLEVKQRFWDIFQEENYPTEFPYKSKVILLFQKIGGVEVCLFGMYVQEFGAECQFPNQRRVYLSYLDSVKYFRPEIKAVTGEALRTFVYHEILIGYLEYCKKRGFTSCYIWACPPLKGEDYILYCHPEIQKTPKSDKLREWYLSMLKKASKENVVVSLTNLYDHFFTSTGECKAKVTAARLPYFDGDYWPGAAEDIINQLRQEEDGRKQQKKGKTKLTLTKRALKAAGQTDLASNASKDALLMQKIGQTISPMKEDFIMVHLQHACTHCCTLLVSGNRWVCNICKSFLLCDKCYERECKLDYMDRHPISRREKHDLFPIEITDVPADTNDNDENIESEFFDTRQAFLSLCQGNHYQYDTLRRAKHSSMMVLYHLHNPTAPAFVTPCNVCHRDIESGKAWHCEVCPDFDVCNECHQKDGGVDHPHKLTNHPSNADRDAQNQEARQKRVKQLRKMLDLLVHASQCRSSNCQYPFCRKVKGLFRHGIHCKTRASGGCLLCKKMWYILQRHACTCKDSDCHVPRCRDLKEHFRRLQQQADSRRRAAVMEMMRQRAAELQGTDN